MIKGFNFSRDFVSRKTVSDFVARQFYFALPLKKINNYTHTTNEQYIYIWYRATERFSSL